VIIVPIYGIVSAAALRCINPPRCGRQMPGSRRKAQYFTICRIDRHRNARESLQSDANTAFLFAGLV